MEINIYKKKLSRVKSRIAYVYPSLYKVMISGLSTDIVYHLLNSKEEIYVERFHCSKITGIEEEPRSLETSSKLRDFPLILTTLHYEPDIVNLIRLLIGSNIEVFSSKRRDHVIIAGGPVVMENPVTYSDIIDAFVIGEAETTLDEIINLWLEHSDSKLRFLEELSNLEYVYVPGYTNRKTRRKITENLDSAFYPVKQVENTHIEPIYGRGFKLEVSRGCLFWCGFCIETRVFQPYRERSLHVLKEIINKGSSYSIESRRLVLYSLVFPVSSTHLKLLEHLVLEGFKAALPSLRISKYLDDSLDYIRLLGQKTLTIAVESFSPSIQSMICKYPCLLGYVNDFIKNAIMKEFDIKIYLIYGFKGINVEEIKHEIEEIRKIAKLAKDHGSRVIISLNPLVPKPHTPFQWIGMSNQDRLKKILGFYKSSLKGLVESRLYDIDWAIIQAQLALSSKPLGEFILKWSLNGGGLSAWRRTIRESNIDFKYVFDGYEIDEHLPWEFIEMDNNVDKVTRAQYEILRKIVRFT
ncbi:MAG: radical SAM protein [Desulfurococcaceae archaeon]